MRFTAASVPESRREANQRVRLRADALSTPGMKRVTNLIKENRAVRGASRPLYTRYRQWLPYLARFSKYINVQHASIDT